MLRALPRLLLVAVVCIVALPARAQLIDFESTPGGGSPTDDGLLSTPYPLAGGGDVRFFFDTNSNNVYDAGTDIDPAFEHTGNETNNGFSNDALGVPDTAAPGYESQLGFWFLRHPSPGSVPPRLIVDYNTAQTITDLSGEIWDIDGQSQATEAWRIDVLNASNSILATYFSPVGADGTLDAKPWVFALTGLPAGVDKLRIGFIGTKTSGLGLAFNNFSPLSVPEPSTALLACAGSLMCLLTAVRRGKRCG